MDGEYVENADESMPSSQAVRPYSIAHVNRIKERLGEFENQIMELNEKLELMVIRDEKDCQKMVDTIIQARRFESQIKEVAGEAVKDPKNFMDQVQGVAKKFLGRLSSMTEIGNRKIADFGYRLEVERRKKLKQAETFKKEYQRELDDYVEGVEADKIEIADMLIPAEKSKIEGETGNAYISMNEEIRIVDESKVPKKYLVPDLKKIKAAFKAGIRDIPGTEVVEVPKAMVRVK